MYDSILAPTDGSDAAEKAVEGALALANQFNATLHVIYVVERNEFPRQVESEASAGVAQQGQAIVNAVTERADKEGVS